MDLTSFTSENEASVNESDSDHYDGHRYPSALFISCSTTPSATFLLSTTTVSTIPRTKMAMLG